MALCREVVALLTDYVEGRLDHETRIRLDEHFQDCSPCESFLQSFRQSIQLVGELAEDVPIPPEMEERLRRFLKNRKL